MRSFSGRSLRFRLGALAAAAITSALAVALIGQSYLFERHLERRFGAELTAYLDRLAGAASFTEDGALTISTTFADPRFARVYSGLYWQVEDERSGAAIRSRSLWDQALAAPRDRTAAVGTIQAYDLAGPGGATLLAHERRLVLRSQGEERPARFVVAVDRGEIEALTRNFALETGVGLMMLAALLTMASVFQLGLGLRPFAHLRRSVAEIRSGGARRLQIDAPSEIEPLVAEVNALLESHERSIVKARRRAADLAHGFNTPLTSLLSDARRLRRRGEASIAGEIEETVRAMRRQIERELARARTVDERSPAPSIAVAPLVDGLLRTIARTPDGERVALTADLGDAPEQVRAAVAAEDLAELLGNLLENACRHAASAVRLSVCADSERVRFVIEDDGPGVSESKRAAILDRGLRLDRTGAGAGLGLAIVKDVLERYGAELSLDAAALGGLAASFELPAPAAPM